MAGRTFARVAATTPRTKHEPSRRGTVSQPRAAAPKHRDRPPIQAKLRLGPVGDRHEQEADRVAGLRAPDLRWRAPQPVQDGRGAEVGTAVRSAVDGARGRGRPLPDDVRGQLEEQLGADFGGVRVHDDPLADRLNGVLNARAFTTGPDIFFSRGEYRPASADGRHLLTHELAHVVQQGESGGGRGGDDVIQRVARPGSYTFTGVKKDLTNAYRPVFLMSTQADAVSGGEDVVMKFQPMGELMDELFFSKVAGRSRQEVPDMRMATDQEITGCRALAPQKSMNKAHDDDPALVMDAVAGKNLSILRDAGKTSYELSKGQSHNIGRLMAFQMFMGGQDMLPVPGVVNTNPGNLLVSDDPASDAVTMIDVTAGTYTPVNGQPRPVSDAMRGGVKTLMKEKAGGPLTKNAKQGLASLVWTNHDVGTKGRKKMRKGFIASMRDIGNMDLDRFYQDWTDVFPDPNNKRRNEVEYLRVRQNFYRHELQKRYG